jgi:hypothetical protein
VSPVKYELGFYIQEDDILHSHRRENLKSYIVCFILFRISEDGQVDKLSNADSCRSVTKSSVSSPRRGHSFITAESEISRSELAMT